ncbi:MAG TPA: response regulator transcription factor [Methylovirgula sp.]|nr:response regulator transcription factor [Methylovirgula sp.]
MPSDKRSLLIVDDDPAFAWALRRSFERRGYEVVVCERAGALTDVLEKMSPDYAVVDLKLVGSSGLECVKRLHRLCPTTKIVVLTGFASIATAVEAVKLGARHYLAKPSNADDIEAAFEREEGDTNVAVGQRISSIKTLEWERIHETLVETEFNISETARRLGMHRRTLARKLSKRRIV